MTKMTALEIKRQEKIEEIEVSQEEMEAFIPKPVGYRVLVALPNVEETFSNGILKAAKTLHEEYVLSKHTRIKTDSLLAPGVKPGTL